MVLSNRLLELRWLLKQATYVEVKGTHLYIKPYVKQALPLISCSKPSELLEALNRLTRKEDLRESLSGTFKLLF